MNGSVERMWMMRKFGWLFMAGVILAIGSPTRGEGTSITEQELAKRGEASIARIYKEGGAWTSVLDLNRHILFVTETRHDGKRMRKRIYAEMNAKRELLAEVIEADGSWYVTQNEKRERYRPYETCFDIPGLYAIRSLSDARIADGRPFKVVERVGDRISVRMPLEGSQRAMAENVLQQLKQVAANIPEGSNRELAKQLTQIDEMLRNGLLSEYDEKTGLMTKLVNAKFALTTRDIAVGAAEEIKLDPSLYKDETGALSREPNDVISIGHVPGWIPAHGKPSDMELVRLELKTGRKRRVPFEGPAMGGGYLMPGGKFVLISGMQFETGMMQLFKIDLESGANQLFGGERAKRGMNMFSTISPDGKLACFMHKDMSKGSVLDSEIVAVDIATEKERVIGEAADYGVPSWTATNEIVIVRRPKVDLTKREALEKQETPLIIKLTLEGQATELVRGSMATVIGDGRTILFRNDVAWHLCDLDGKNVRVFGDGLRKYSFPAASPDGKRVLMMYFEGRDKGPQPVMINIADGVPQKVDAGEGFWAMPVWR